MKAFALCMSILLLGLGKASPQQPSEPAESCGFTVSGSPAKAVITGPEDIVPLVYVVDQPDSPVEILAVDFSDSFLSFTRDQVTATLHCVVTVHNRTEKRVKGFGINVFVAGKSGAPAGVGLDSVRSGAPELAPGQELQIRGCGVMGNGGAPDNYVRILVYVSGVNMGDCLYEPSKRIPIKLGVWPVI
jgi:hypothetical protein